MKDSYFSFAKERGRRFVAPEGVSQTLSSGFTLIEALIAVTIITFAVAGPLYTANRAIVAAQGARLQLVASDLAQEGIEHVHAMRDDEYLGTYQMGGVNISGDAWTAFTTLIDPCVTTTCMLDPTHTMGVGAVGTNNSLQTCLGTCAPLYLANNGTSDIYTPRTDLGGTVTLFTRTIQVSTVPPGDPLSKDMRIVSIVSWSFHGTPYSITVSDHLTPWQ